MVSGFIERGYGGGVSAGRVGVGGVVLTHLVINGQLPLTTDLGEQQEQGLSTGFVFIYLFIYFLPYNMNK